MYIRFFNWKQCLACFYICNDTISCTNHSMPYPDLFLWNDTMPRSAKNQWQKIWNLIFIFLQNTISGKYPDLIYCKRWSFILSSRIFVLTISAPAKIWDILSLAKTPQSAAFVYCCHAYTLTSKSLPMHLKMLQIYISPCFLTLAWNGLSTDCPFCSLNISFCLSTVTWRPYWVWNFYFSDG